MDRNVTKLQPLTTKRTETHGNCADGSIFIGVHARIPHDGAKVKAGWAICQVAGGARIKLIISPNRLAIGGGVCDDLPINR